MFRVSEVTPGTIRKSLSHNWGGLIAGLAAVLLLAPAVQAQDAGDQSGKQAGPAQPAEKAPLEESKLNERIETIQGNTDLDEATKAKLLDLYKQAAAFAKERDGNVKKAEELSAFVKSAGPRRLEEIREKEKEIKPFDPATVAPLAEKMSQPELKSRVEDEANTLSELESRIDNTSDELKSARDRSDEIGPEIDQVEEKLKKLSEQPAAKPSGAQAARLAEAFRLKRTAERQMLNAERAALRQERLSIPLKLNVLTAEQELLAFQKKGAERLLEAWRKAAAVRNEALSKKRITEASRVLARAEAEKWPEFLRNVARNNVSYSKALSAINSSSIKSEINISLLKEKLAGVKANYNRTIKQVKSMGLTPTAGVFFQRRLRTLSRIRVPTEAAARRRREIRRITEEELNLQDLREEVALLDSEDVHKRLAHLKLPPGRQKELEEQGIKVIQQAKTLLGELTAACSHYLTVLADEGYAERALLLEAGSYANFLNTRLLWTKSNQPFSIADLLFTGKTFSRLFSPMCWRLFCGDLIASLKRAPVGWAIWLLLLIFWIAVYSRTGRHARALDDQVGVVGHDSILLTVRALLLAVVRAGGLPLLVYLAASRLWMLPGSQVFTRSVCAGLIASAKILFGAWLVIEVFGPRGVGKVHFGWPEAACGSMGRCAKRVILLIIPLTFFMLILNTGLSVAARSSLGRLLFMVMIIAFAAIASRPLRPGGPVLSLPAFLKTSGFLAKTRRVWFPLAIAIPLLLLVLAALGYYHSVIAIGGAILRTIALLLALVFIRAFLLNWLSLSQQQLEPGEKSRGAEGAGGKAGEKDASGLRERQPDPDDIGRHASLLIRLFIVVLALAGLYVIWEKNIPVLQALNGIILWSLQVGLDASQQPLLKSVTLGSLFTCAIILWFTAVIARNISGLLDLIVFRRLKMDAGNSHAFGLISRYAVIIVGVTLAMNSIGIGWHKVQWLIAALTVGLGFGLQDIVANFVSGIIILFEKPIRIGDTVTVSGTSGRVTRIQIRSTTITDWDRHETIVPNKIFLTDKIVNWSLSDSIIRVVIDIGIAYGSDTAKAQDILLRIARENPLVINEPAPSVVFSNFGDNSLDFKLRAFVHTRDRVRAPHQLRLAINEAFNSAGIEIPFPQRDTHLDGSRPLDVRIVKGDSCPDPPEQAG